MAERPGPEGIIEGTPLSTRRDKPWRLKDGVLRHDQAILAEEIIIVTTPQNLKQRCVGADLLPSNKNQVHLGAPELLFLTFSSSPQLASHQSVSQPSKILPSSSLALSFESLP